MKLIQKYNKNDEINFHAQDIKKLKIFGNQIKNILIMQKYGCTVFEIWESDMNKLNDEELSIYIINLLKI